LHKPPHPIIIGLLICIIAACAAFCALVVGHGIVPSGVMMENITYNASNASSSFPLPLPIPVLDKVLYDKKMEYLAHSLSFDLATTTATTTIAFPAASMTASTTASSTSHVASSTPSLWPVKTAPYPDYGALLPFNRIVAYYGNFYTKDLGVLGEYPPQQMLAMLMGEVAKWQAADPTTPVIPALDYITVTAQGSPGADGKYRLRMPADQIEEAIALANQVHGIVFLDVQVGLSNVETEVPLLASYLAEPNVELALDPEFDMPNGARPDSVIGTMSAADINFAANYLATIVRQDNLPPKILVVHRFTEKMVTDSQNITPLPEVEVVIDMDGWGTPAQKVKIYKEVITGYPVQFTGLKIFYKNDLIPPCNRLLTQKEILNLSPQPSYIQYQ
jgi:hypothetical protein